MKVSELLYLLDENFPVFLQESFDNTGNQVVFPEEEISGVYICLDPDRFVINDAIALNCNLIISHHPLIFKPLRSVVQGDVKSENIINLISKRISLYSMHTNFDKIMYSYLAEVLGFKNTSVLLETDVFENKPLGLGSFAEINKGIEFRLIMDIVKDKLNLDYIIYAGDRNSIINRIAFLNGSGGSSIDRVIKNNNPDCIITGDVGYHHIKSAIENNKCVIDAGHFGTEKIFKKLLAGIVKRNFGNAAASVKVFESEIEKNPFKVY